MVDICIRRFQTPFFRVNGKIYRHILVNFLLQIHARFAKSANHDIRANAFFNRNVAVRIRDDGVVGVVSFCQSRLLDGAQAEDVLFNWKITGHFRYF